MINWHRLFGLALTDLFIHSPYDVEVEIDLSNRVGRVRRAVDNAKVIHSFQCAP